MTIATRPLLLALCVVLAVVAGAPRVARADPAEAEVLFREGKRLMKKGDLAEACKKLAASERADAKTGTELNLASCYEKNHQTASAWAMFLEAAASAKRAGNDRAREAEAKKRAAALEDQLVYLTINVPVKHPAGLAIAMNDKPVDPTLYGQRTPVDPDDYTVSATADGFAPWQTQVSVKAKDKTVDVPELEPKPVAAPTAPVAPVAAAAPATRAVVPPPTGEHLRRAPLALAIAGVVVIGAGAGLGAYSHAQENDANNACANQACGVKSAVDESSRARSTAIAADVGFAVGGAAVAAAVVWWAVAGVHESDQRAYTLVPSVNVGGVGLAAVGHF